ncbi:MAG TPA: hypothetical protein VHO07_13850, partial [Streptosporangiaceae bacterium]|nr:hypothetical protein [Streptosporangiaceae bacterium]
ACRCSPRRWSAVAAPERAALYRVHIHMEREIWGRTFLRRGKKSMVLAYLAASGEPVRVAEGNGTRWVWSGWQVCRGYHWHCQSLIMVNTRPYRPQQ